MAGCFGSHPIDRWMERRLDDYLDRTYGDDEEEDGDDEYGEDDECCPECGASLDDDGRCTQPAKHNGGVEWED